jgi:hypothetical protein
MKSKEPNDLTFKPTPNRFRQLARATLFDAKEKNAGLVSRLSNLSTSERVSYQLSKLPRALDEKKSIRFYREKKIKLYRARLNLSACISNEFEASSMKYRIWQA